MNQLTNERAQSVCAAYTVSNHKKGSHAAKKAVCAVILRFLFHGLRVLDRKDERMQAETSDWEDGFLCVIETGEQSPALYMRKTKRGLTAVAKQDRCPEQADLLIRFKSLDAAFQVMSGQVSVAVSYARHGFVLKGDIARAMSLVRCIDLVERYLFPKWMAKRILKGLPEKKTTLAGMYVRTVGDMMFGLYGAGISSVSEEGERHAA